METSLLTSKGQLLIPVSLRKKYGMEPGSKVLLEETESGVMIRPVNEKYVKSFRGILSSNGKLKEEVKAYKEDEKGKEKRKLQLHSKKKKAM